LADGKRSLVALETSMEEVDSGQPTSGKPLVQTAGEQLRAAREAHGVTLAEIGTRTRVPLRHLEALEVGDYASLPSPTYAVGFAKAYARAAGADEVAVAASVRSELDRAGPRAPEYVPYETADPARVPSRGVVGLGVGIALAVLILVGLYYGTDLFRSAGSGGAIPVETAAAPPAARQAVPPPAATPAAPTGGQVTLLATDEVWLRVYDAANKTLFLGTMKPGDKFDVPANADDPKINVGRPDKLTVSLNGSAVPPLGTGERPIKDVRVSGAAIAARLAGAPAAGATSAAAASTAARTADRARPPRARLTETQRANLASPRPAAGNAP